jgi:hypothetical protein
MSTTTPTPHQPPQKRTAKASRTTPEQKLTQAYTYEQRHNPEHAPEQTHPLEHPVAAAHAQHPKEQWIEKKDNIKKRFPDVTDQDLSFWG